MSFWQRVREYFGVGARPAYHRHRYETTAVQQVKPPIMQLTGQTILLRGCAEPGCTAVYTRRLEGIWAHSTIRKAEMLGTPEVPAGQLPSAASVLKEAVN